MALSLKRKTGEAILIGEAILVTVARGSRGHLVLRVDAPDNCRILRAELAGTIPGHPGTVESSQPAAKRGSNRHRRKGRRITAKTMKLPPLAERTDALARWVKRRRKWRGGDVGPCGIAA